MSGSSGARADTPHQQDQDVRMVRVHVVAGARKERVERRSDGRYDIAVREQAARGAANRRVRELVAEYEGAARAQVRLRTGQRSPHKSFIIIG